MRKLPFLYVLIFFICSCKFFHKNSDQLLVTVYGDKLYFSDIKHLLSPDLNSSDSLNLVRQLCEKWAKEQLLLNKAKINLPIVLQNVKTQVKSYENSLLIYSYQKELLSQKLDTIVGTDGMGASQTEDLVGGAGGATVTSTKFYNTVTSITGNGAASVDITAGVTSTGMHAVLWTGRTRIKGMHGVISSADNFSPPPATLS